MSRRLVAALPCRCNSTRLWGKPLQPLAPGVSIVEHLASSLRQCDCVAEVRLAIARGGGEDALVDLAERAGLKYLLGSEDDVLGRVIATARQAGATDVLRKTSEDPFLHASMLEPAWERHLVGGNDVTALDLVPEGTAFEIFTLAALERCHDLGEEADREHIANYARFHQSEFAIEILHPEPTCRRPDLRLTVDNPQDLILCRAVFSRLDGRARTIPLAEIVAFLDAHPELTDLVHTFVDPSPTWEGVPQLGPVPPLPAKRDLARAAMPDMDRIGRLERTYVSEVLDGGFRTSSGGTMTTRLEGAFAELVGADFAVAFVNGTATMHAALAAAGIGPGAEVIVPPLTMASTTLAVLHAGAVPVFADVDPATFNLDPVSVAERLTPRTRAIIPVALYGLPPDLDALMRIAEEHELLVLEDDAEAVMARIGERRLGAIGHAASFSLQSSKHLTSGEGGLITTNDGDLAERIRRFNSLGYAAIGARRSAISPADIQDPGYCRHVSFGFNYRLPELCAAVALAQVERAAELVQRRVVIAELFAEAVEGADWLVPQHMPEGVTHTYWTYVMRLAEPAISWQEFRRVFLREGGDPFYGAWRLTYLEPLFAQGCPVVHPGYEGTYQTYAHGLCPVAERIQPRLIQLKTNYWAMAEAERQAQALRDTIASIEGRS